MLSARWQLQIVRQKEDESLEEFSQWFIFLQCMDILVPGRTVETFLRCCRDKEAGHSAMDRNPNSFYKALKFLKASVNNKKVLVQN